MLMLVPFVFLVFHIMDGEELPRNVLDYKTYMMDRQRVNISKRRYKI